jgi:hypothetical protein
LERVARHAALLAHRVEFFLETGALLPELVQIRLVLLARGLEIRQGVFESSCQLLLGKQVLLDRANASLLVFDNLGVSNVLALVA